jgi:hypothetical protein
MFCFLFQNENSENQRCLKISHEVDFDSDEDSLDSKRF